MHRLHTRPRAVVQPEPPVDGGSAATAEHTVSWTPVLRVLAALVAVLTVVGVTVDLVDDTLPDADGPVRGALDVLQRWTTLDAEAALPAWFAVSVLLLLALTLALVALCQRAAGGAAGRYWVLTAVALYLSADEGASLHEEAGRITGQFVDRATIGTFTWVVPGALLALVVGVLLLRLARGVPARLRARLLVAGLVYLTGALVVEALSGTVSSSTACLEGACPSEGPNVPYVLLSTLEEALEMTGAVLALRAALLQLRVRVGGGRLSLDLAPGTGAAGVK